MDTSNSLEVRDAVQLNAAVEKMGTVITKNYLAELSEYDMVDIDSSIAEKDISEYARLYKLDKFVYQKDESMIDKMSTVLNSAFTNGATVVTIIDSDGDKTDYYLGVVDKRGDDGAMAGNTFRGALEGNFQGSDLKELKSEQVNELISRITHGDNCEGIDERRFVSSVSAIPSLRKKGRDEIKTYTQGIENMVDALHGKRYTAVMIADPIPPVELDRMELGYEMLYTQLSPYAKSAYSINESETTGTSHSDSTSITNTINQSVGYSSNTSTSSSWSTSENESISRGGEGLTSLGGIIGMIPNPVTNIAGALMTLAGSAMPKKSHGTTKSQSGSESKSQGESKSSGSSESKGESSTDSISESNQRGQSLQISSVNKTVQNMLGKIDEHIARIKACRVYGAFNCSTYIISGSTETNSVVSANYNALIRGEASSMQASYVNTWGDDKAGEVKLLKKYISKFTHPIFVKPGDKAKNLPLDAGSVITGQELAVQTGLPKRSINGISVVESAPFGRNIYRLSDYAPERTIDAGRIYHMGKKSTTPVRLDLDSLTSHVFVTGSTGSGKSNTVYELLDKAAEQDVKFLVVEPAKGEYKDIFGGRDNVTVYGTNPEISQLLRINPFSFAKGIHILEHLDRLIEIFNVCWPMYAAMPAVLKKAVERAYEACGWDLMTSKNKVDDSLYPTFNDVLNQIHIVVNDSSYSADSKSDYIGSLATRVESLTNGFYKMIFTNNSIPDEKLFNENVIIDLSRVGSQETKSFIMGLMVMKLQEYYMSGGNSSNSSLKHITILEEAHNILKKTSTEQSSESSNVLGKSVEMIANAIAEMRTYGEGFIIADQSPGLMDMSVIRNTNTKIILRLPDYGDRQLVGKAIGLNEQQIDELSKLPRGVAAIYQNDWIEAVLCKVEKFDEEPKPYQKPLDGWKGYETDKDVEKALLDLIMTQETRSETEDLVALRKLRSGVMKSGIAGAVKYDFIQYINNHRKPDQKEKYLKFISSFFNTAQVVDRAAQSADDIELWIKSIMSNLPYDISEYSDNQRNTLIHNLVYSVNDGRYDSILEYTYDLLNQGVK